MTAAVARQEDIAFQANLYADPNETRRALHRNRRDWVISRALGRVSSGARVLEVGIGCGVFTRTLSKVGAKVTAVDINPKFVTGVGHLPNVQAMVADATRTLPVGDHDVALCSEVLEHVSPEQSLNMLRSIRAALRPDGTLLLTTPQSYSTVEMMARLFRFKPILALARRLYGNADALGHINLLTSSQLKHQIADAGFTIEDETLFGFYLPIVAEFGGHGGQRFLASAGRVIARVPLLRGLLWTQAYVLRRV